MNDVRNHIPRLPPRIFWDFAVMFAPQDWDKLGFLHAEFWAIFSVIFGCNRLPNMVV